jgi:hypothetical protein
VLLRDVTRRIALKLKRKGAGGEEGYVRFATKKKGVDISVAYWF